MNDVTKILLQHLQRMRPNQGIVDVAVHTALGEPENFRARLQLCTDDDSTPAYVTTNRAFHWSRLAGNLCELSFDIAKDCLTHPFVREERYLVFKMSDMDWAFSDAETRQLFQLHGCAQANRVQRGKEPLKTVVVEHDWPEYEPTWKAIQQRVENEQQKGLTQ